MFRTSVSNYIISRPDSFYENATFIYQSFRDQTCCQSSVFFTL
jgi:hypothetical protein